MSSKLSDGNRRRRGLYARFKETLQANRLGDLLVANGALSESQLCLALAAQASGTGRLGDILVRDRFVARRVIYSALAQQWTMRALAAGMTCVISLSGPAMREARAGIIDDVPTKLALVTQQSSGYAPMASYPALFGTEERSSTNISPFTKWTSMFVHFQMDAHKAKYQAELADWRRALQPMAHLPLKEQAERVNALMNAQPYVEDQDNYHVSDYWADPLEFLAKGGDCEDYAIAKYASLRMLGVPDSNMRLAIVRDMERGGIPHAILILYAQNGESMVLDNQAATVRSAAMVARYQPIFSINEGAWWLHKAPDATLVASAY